MHLKDELSPKYSELVYNGFWFSPERKMLQVLPGAPRNPHHLHHTACRP
jgi:argininosuccinate synthase